MSCISTELKMVKVVDGGNRKVLDLRKIKMKLAYLMARIWLDSISMDAH